MTESIYIPPALPAGGSQGQVLTKGKSNTQWANPGAILFFAGSFLATGTGTQMVFQYTNSSLTSYTRCIVQSTDLLTIVGSSSLSGNTMTVNCTSAIGLGHNVTFNFICT